MPTTEFIARVILPSSGHVMLVNKVDRDYYYLPGGHIEFGEKAAISLAREMEEEIGGQIEVHQFVAAMEHSFVDNKESQKHEINLVFLGRLLSHTFPDIPQSLEPDLVYSWHPIENLGILPLFPPDTARMIQELYEMGRTTSWYSSVPD
ncbi:MAG: NUDIX domain-containing protein [Anaerolineales bacterium]|nr:NUDIX domain-containing protein [Anaerolineales bacterium]